MDDNQINMKEWEMANDRIKYFNQMCFQLRERGFLVAGAIQAVAIASIAYTQTIRVGAISLTALILYLGTCYLIPIILLDMFYFHMLLTSVNYAIKLEEKFFHDTLGLTNLLTSNGKTAFHLISAGILYVILFVFGFYIGSIVA
jgi:hypothetical protein